MTLLKPPGSKLVNRMGSCSSPHEALLRKVWSRKKCSVPLRFNQNGLSQLTERMTGAQQGRMQIFFRV